MSDLKRYIEKQMQDPEFWAEYEASETEFQLTRSLIAARTAFNMTQKELAGKSGVRQSKSKDLGHFVSEGYFAKEGTAE